LVSQQVSSGERQKETIPYLLLTQPFTKTKKE